MPQALENCDIYKIAGMYICGWRSSGSTPERGNPQPNDIWHSRKMWVQYSGYIVLRVAVEDQKLIVQFIDCCGPIESIHKAEPVDHDLRIASQILYNLGGKGAASSVGLDISNGKLCCLHYGIAVVIDKYWNCSVTWSVKEYSYL
jgi:hypothetical protein